MVLDEEGKRKLMGFYATRYVEASNKDEAEQRALENLKSNDWLQGLKENRKSDDPVAMVYFEEIVEVTQAYKPDRGFAFFEMENSANKSESECKT